MVMEAYSLINLVLDAFTNKRLYKESILFIQETPSIIYKHINYSQRVSYQPLGLLRYLQERLRLQLLR
jgi:hypothetical protein